MIILSADRKVFGILHSVTEEAVYSQLGRLFQSLLLEAEVSNVAEEQAHGEWLREALNKKLDEMSRSFH